MDRVSSGAGLAATNIHGGGYLVPSIDIRVDGNGGGMLTTCPLVGDAACPTVGISIQCDRFASASHLGAGDLHIGTEAENFERHRGGLTTMGALHNNRVNARSADLFCSVGAEG